MSALTSSEDVNTAVPGLQNRRHSVGDSPLRASSSTSELADRGTTVNDLPDEVLLEIFSYMSFSENINILQEVCARWKILAQDAHLWYHREYAMGYDTSEEEAIATFAAVPQLRTVILHKEVSPRVFKALSRSCPHLTTLQTNYRQGLTYSDAVNLFAGCKEIRSLNISDKGLVADVRFMDAVAHLADLRELRLQRSGSAELRIPLHALAEGCPHLCVLDLELFCYEIQDAEYFICSHKHVLKQLRTRRTSVEGRSITLLLPACAEALECLELLDCTISREEAAESIAALGQLHNLRQLDFRVDEWQDRHLLPAMFRNGRLAKLQRLGLAGCVTDETACAVAEHCTELRELSLWNCAGHSDALFEQLRRLQKLETLKIQSHNCLGGKAMSYIAKLPALHTLHFSFIRFQLLQPSVDSILKMSGLRRLFLKESICWDIPFDKFPGRLVNLRELEIDYCDGDQRVLDRIRAQMPDLRVEGSLGAFFTDEDDDM